ncbi:MAG: hypothetical protein IT548_03155 [Alphaproteobacteria bacterium]|nr:hypothetical protein [Alphaproteobacteria bacterium]
MTRSSDGKDDAARRGAMAEAGDSYSAAMMRRVAAKSARSLPLTIAPMTLPQTIWRCVGIFWVVEDRLLVARTKLSEAELYGDCLTHSDGHYEQWQRWQRLGAGGLASEGLPVAILSSEHDSWPRGRVVFDAAAVRFMLYADARLHTAAVRETLIRAFGLEGQDAVMALDAHYR